MKSDLRKELINEPRMYGKSTLVTNAFLASAKNGESVSFESLDYVCLSRKALSNLLHTHMTSVLGDRGHNAKCYAEEDDNEDCICGAETINKFLASLREKIKEME